MLVRDANIPAGAAWIRLAANNHSDHNPADVRHHLNRLSCEQNYASNHDCTHVSRAITAVGQDAQLAVSSVALVMCATKSACPGYAKT